MALPAARRESFATGAGPVTPRRRGLRGHRDPERAPGPVARVVPARRDQGRTRARRQRARPRPRPSPISARPRSVRVPAAAYRSVRVLAAAFSACPRPVRVLAAVSARPRPRRVPRPVRVSAAAIATRPRPRRVPRPVRVPAADEPATRTNPRSARGRSASFAAASPRPAFQTPRARRRTAWPTAGAGTRTTST